MRSLTQVSGDRAGSLVVARVEGEVDASNAAWTGARLRALLSNRSTGLAVDLTGTTYLDSAGIAQLFALAAELRAHQQQLHLVVDPESLIARTLALSGLTGTVPTHPTLEAAREQAGG